MQARGTVKILNNEQNPGLVPSDVGAGLEAPAVSRLGRGAGGAVGPGEGPGSLQEARGHGFRWEISYLPTSAKINCRESAWGVGQTGFSPASHLAAFPHLCERDIA